MNDLPPAYYPYPPPGTYAPYAPYALDPVSGRPLNPGMAPAVNPYAMPPAYYPPAAMPAQAAPPTGMLTNPAFLKGAVIGGLAAYLLTNDQVQQALIRNSVKVWALFQGGVEEMKERFRDAEAELHASQAADPE
jgi:hypothetical protein